MKLLITGGAGYVGSSLATQYVLQGHEVIVWDRLNHGGESLIHLIGNSGFSVIIGDVLEFDPPKDVNAVIHLAAIVGEPACIEAGKTEARQANVIAAKKMAETYKDVRFLFFSTCSNYGISGPRSVKEESPLKPTGIYSETKVEAERVVRENGGIVLRFATVCGPSPRPRFDLLINEIAKRAITGEEMVFFAPNSWRPFIHIHDVATAAMKAIEYAPPGSTYNVIGENWTKRAIYKKAKRIFPDASMRMNEDEGDDPRNYLVDGRRFEGQFGFRATRTIDAAMREVAEQVRLMPELGRRIYRNVA